MKKIFLSILFFLCSMTSIVFAQSEEYTEWKRVDENSYIDSDVIVGAEDIYGFTFLLKSYNKGQYEPVNGKFIFYTLAQYTIDCAKRSYKIGVMDSYGKQDNFITGDYNKYAEFQPIVGGTAVSNVYKKLCRPVD
ncbi:MAG: hypothetical protein UDK34_09415 [Cyanobacteriota bacterium]|nr:hypothetical protein [Cyanobacteriota bacterium]